MGLILRLLLGLLMGDGRNMVGKNILGCIDRDGTIIYDKKYHLGHQINWKRKVKLLENVVKGLKKLRKIKNIRIYN